MYNRCSRSGIEYIPEFCFTQLAGLITTGIAIIRVNLYGEFVVRIDELCQEWKALSENSDGLLAKQLSSIILHQRA